MLSYFRFYIMILWRIFSIQSIQALYLLFFFIKQTIDVVGQQGGFLDCRDCCTVRRSPWTALRSGVVQHGEFHSAEHAGGEIASMAITTVLSRRSTRRVSLRILQRLKTKNIRVTVNLLGMCMRWHASSWRGMTGKYFFMKQTWTINY